MKNKIRRIVSLLLVFVLLIIGVPITVKAQTYAVGDIIEFGLYPQSEVTDDMLKTVLVEQEINDKGDLIYNGKKYRRYNYNNVTHFFVFEPIEWKIMSNNADGLYVISKKILNIQQYNTTNCSITWENCSLRTWLNDTFYSDAFSEDEKKMITYRETENKKNPIFGTEGGNNTWDKVFIPSIYDASNSTYGFSTHYNVDSNRMAHRTRYASAIVGSTSESTDSWWLRTPGAQDNTACSVSSSGYISTTNTVYSKDREVTYYFGIRPAIYLDDYDKYEGPQTKPEDTNTKKEYKIGDLIEFGSYPQSEVTNEELKAALAAQSIDSNGDVLYGGQKYRRVVLSNTSHFYLYEPIEWQVLNCGNDRLFVVSKNVLSNQKYNSINEDVSWENCTLRTWLNDLFYNEAFSDTEKNAIKNVKLLNDNNPVYGTDAGNDTWDDVFILSIYDVSNANYGFVADYNASTTRVAYTTSYASAIIGSTSKSASTWWLRSPGQQANRACSITNTGYISTSNYVYSHDREVTYTFGIRPAVYLDVEVYNSIEGGGNDACTDGHAWDISADGLYFLCKNCNKQMEIKMDVPNDVIEFNGHYYKAFEEKMCWTDAKVYCESIGGHLATITSELENYFVLSLATDVYYFLGGTNVNQEGTWSWVTGEEWIYSNWNGGEPNNGLDGNVQNFLSMYGIEDYRRGTWDNNANNFNYFICEWDFVPNLYNLGEETYSFENYEDEDNGGHCFGMSVTSAGYHLGYLDPAYVGINNASEVSLLPDNAIVKEPINYYQNIQGSLRNNSIVAGGTEFKDVSKTDIEKDWKEIENYVKNHAYDYSGSLIIGYISASSSLHCVNFLRYDDINGSIYVYDSNDPSVEYSFSYNDGKVCYLDVSDITSIALIHVPTYFELVSDKEMVEKILRYSIYCIGGVIAIQYGAIPFMMATDYQGDVYYVYEISEELTEIEIIPLVDNATFSYMGQTYSFDKVDEGTYATLKLSTSKDIIPEFNIVSPELPTEPEKPDEPDVNCSCLCHSKDSFIQLIYTIIRFIWQLFGMNMDCACGAKHFDSYFFA